MDRESFDRNHFLSTAKDYGKRGLHSGFGTLGDFRKFLLRGNVVDLAVGVVIGAAFNGVVTSMVKDLITPLIGLFIGVNDFSRFNYPFNRQVFAFGDLLNVALGFILTAAVVYFFVVKPINALEDRYNRLRPKKEEAPTTRECPFCLSTVPLKATRCAYCTAQLPPADQPEAAVAQS